MAPSDVDNFDFRARFRSYGFIIRLFDSLSGVWRDELINLAD
jgi:hypothetical protein